MILGFDAAWLEINKGFTKELEGWIRDILADHSDVYFVTQIQVCKNQPLILGLLSTREIIYI